MISLAPIIALLAKKPDAFPHQWFRNVEGAAEYAKLSMESLPLPGCWIIRASEKSRHLGERAEELTVGLDVVIAISNARKHKDRSSADDELADYRASVKTRLLGWKDDPQYTAIKFAGGRVLQYTAGDMFWADRYEFKTIISNYLPDPPGYQGLNKTHIGEQP